MWIYSQLFHELYLKTAVSTNLIDADCYAGFGKHQNKPESQCFENLGPLPRGDYTISLKNSEKYILRLEPAVGTDMCGRHNMRIHGEGEDSDPGGASTGCIVVKNRATRKKIWESGDRLLRVIAER